MVRHAREGASPAARCVAALVHVRDHERRDLPRGFHDHHGLTVSPLHVHLDHATCLEVRVLKGQAVALRHFAGHVMAGRGVRHGRLVLLPAGQQDEDGV